MLQTEEKTEKGFNLIAGRVVITTLPPISTEGLCTDDIESLMERTRNAMSDVFQATSREVQLSLATSKHHVQ